jgi:hypothetical protein
MVILLLVFITVNNRIQPYPFINPLEIKGRLFMKSQSFSHQDGVFGAKGRKPTLRSAGAQLLLA